MHYMYPRELKRYQICVCSLQQMYSGFRNSLRVVEIAIPQSRSESIVLALHSSDYQNDGWVEQPGILRIRNAHK